jgi:hypothetical protein
VFEEIEVMKGIMIHHECQQHRTGSIVPERVNTYDNSAAAIDSIKIIAY